MKSNLNGKKHRGDTVPLPTTKPGYLLRQDPAFVLLSSFFLREQYIFICFTKLSNHKNGWMLYIPHAKGMLGFIPVSLRAFRSYGKVLQGYTSPPTADYSNQTAVSEQCTFLCLFRYCRLSF